LSFGRCNGPFRWPSLVSLFTVAHRADFFTTLPQRSFKHTAAAAAAAATNRNFILVSAELSILRLVTSFLCFVYRSSLVYCLPMQQYPMFYTQYINTSNAQSYCRLMAIGGRDGSSCLELVERYSPISDSWSPCASLNRRRAGVAVAECGGFVYAVGGHDCVGPGNSVGVNQRDRAGSSSSSSAAAAAVGSSSAQIVLLDCVERLAMCTMRALCFLRLAWGSLQANENGTVIDDTLLG
jgi:Kelch motif